MLRNFELDKEAYLRTLHNSERTLCPRCKSSGRMSVTRCAAGQTPSPKSGSTRSRNPWRGTPIRIICTCRGLFSHLDTFAYKRMRSKLRKCRTTLLGWRLMGNISPGMNIILGKETRYIRDLCQYLLLLPHARHFRRCVRSRGRSESLHLARKGQCGRCSGRPHLLAANRQSF